MASVLAKAKQYGKRIIGYPTEEEDVPVVSVAHWIRGLSQDPKRDVRPLVQLPHLFSIDTHRYPQILNYAESIFPITGWITRYSMYLSVSSVDLPTHASHSDLGWLYGDVVAGLTVGIVVVPQSMSYAIVSITSSHVRQAG